MDTESTNQYQFSVKMSTIKQLILIKKALAILQFTRAYTLWLGPELNQGHRDFQSHVPP